MPKVFIHAGAPKTGTSFLQFLFAKYADQMRDAGLAYPPDPSLERARKGRVTPGNGVALARCVNPWMPPAELDRDAILAELRGVLAAHAGLDILFSTESIYFRDPGRSEALLQMIRGEGFEPHAVVALRDYAGYARSAFGQSVKRRGEARDFGEFLETWDPAYGSRLAALDRHFPPERLHLVNYDRNRHRLAELYFRDILGLGFVPGDTAVINRSLTAKEIELLRVMNASYPAETREKLATFASEALLAVDRPSDDFALTSAEAAILERRFGAELEKINARPQAPGIRLYSRIGPDRAPLELGDFEISVMSILARIVAAVA